MIGSSNMDFRSFALTSEIVLLAFGGDLVERLERNDADYRSVSRVLTPEEWQRRSWRQKYVDNVCRLTAALLCEVDTTLRHRPRGQADRPPILRVHRSGAGSRA